MFDVSTLFVLNLGPNDEHASSYAHHHARPTLITTRPARQKTALFLLTHSPQLPQCLSNWTCCLKMAVPAPRIDAYRHFGKQMTVTSQNCLMSIATAKPELTVIVTLRRAATLGTVHIVGRCSSNKPMTVMFKMKFSSYSYLDSVWCHRRLIYCAYWWSLPLSFWLDHARPQWGYWVHHFAGLRHHLKIQRPVHALTSLLTANHFQGPTQQRNFQNSPFLFCRFLTPYDVRVLWHTTTGSDCIFRLGDTTSATNCIVVGCRFNIDTVKSAPFWTARNNAIRRVPSYLAWELPSRMTKK